MTTPTDQNNGHKVVNLGGISPLNKDVVPPSFSTPLAKGKDDTFKGMFHTAMGHHNLNDLSLVRLEAARDLLVTECLIDPAAPGRRTILLNSTDPSLSAMADLVRDIDVLKEIVAALATFNLPKDILKAIFATGNRRLKLGTLIGSFGVYYDAIREILPLAKPNTQLFISALFTLEIKPLRLTRPSEALAFVQDRAQRFVDEHQIRAAVQSDAVELALTGYTPGCDALLRKGDEKRDVELGEIVSDISPRWLRLARALTDASRLTKFTDDAFYLVRAYVIADQAKCKAPEEMMASDAVRRLSENISFVKASFSRTVTRFHSPLHELKNAVEYVSAVIQRSKRLQVMRLADLSSEIGHVAISNSKMERVFAVIYQNLAPERGRAQVSHLQAHSNNETFRAQAPLFSVESRLNAIMDPMLGELTPAAAAQAQSEVILMCAESIPADKPIISKILVDERALSIYASHLARRTLITVGDDEVPHLTYEMDTSHINYQGQGELGRMTVTTSPETVILLAANQDVSKAQRAPIQTIPDDMRDAHIAAPTTSLFTSLNRRIAIRAKIGNFSYEVPLLLDRILALEYIAGEAFLTRSPVAEACVQSFYSAALDTFKILGHLNPSKNEEDARYLHHLKRDAAMIIGSRMLPTWSSEIVKMIVQTIMLDMAAAEELSPEERAILRSHVKFKHVTFFLATAVFHALATRLRLVHYETAREMDEIMYTTDAYHQFSRTI